MYVINPIFKQKSMCEWPYFLMLVYELRVRIQRGDRESGPSPWKITSCMGFYIGNWQLDPPPPPRKSGPPGKCWTPSGTLKNDKVPHRRLLHKLEYGINGSTNKYMDQLVALWAHLTSWPQIQFLCYISGVGNGQKPTGTKTH